MDRNEYLDAALDAYDEHVLGLWLREAPLGLYHATLGLAREVNMDSSEILCLALKFMYPDHMVPLGSWVPLILLEDAIRCGLESVVQAVEFKTLLRQGAEAFFDARNIGPSPALRARMPPPTPLILARMYQQMRPDPDFRQISAVERMVASLGHIVEQVINQRPARRHTRKPKTKVSAKKAAVKVKLREAPSVWDRLRKPEV